ncbi:hypothetical protein TWF694_006151 [Orbilia ellipsospora]|uniref:Rab-GAP TBC domain-containing protein n=1 Tax=Orbilia ellipsospora TaxID=2528407 RepID=A0AAV9WSI0_9PEZI
MKDIRQIREQWTAYLRSISSFETLQAASLSDLNIDNGIGHNALRSLLWKSLLLCHKLDVPTVIAAVRKERSTYDEHKAKYLRPLSSEQDPDHFAGSDPLADDESSPWTHLRLDEQLRDEIQKDIDRTYPDTEFFRSVDVQVTLSNVLFIWSRLNPDTSYRQGMHELAAPVYWVVHSDALADITLPDGFTSISITAEDENIMKELLDPKYMEHDTFAIFQKIMLFAKSWYEMGQPGEEKTAGGVPATSPIIRKSEYIHEGLLGAVDPELAYHLDQLGILPQIFLIRWIRLMFGREFTFDETLGLWDGIFVEDPTLQIVDYISVAMMLRIRWKLLEADYSTALTLLLRYEPPTTSPPLTLLKDAIHLRDDLSPPTASKLITKHTLRQPTQDPQPYTRSGTPPPPSSSQASSSTLLTSPRLAGLNNIESIMHDVASGFRDRSERWGVNKALREAMGEVKRVSAGVGEHQRELYKRWTADSMERQIFLASILEESIKAFESDEKQSERQRDAVERVKYVRNCLLDSKVVLDKRWLKEVPDTSSTTAATTSTAEETASNPPLSPTSPTSPQSQQSSIISKPPPFPTYFHANVDAIPADTATTPAPAKPPPHLSPPAPITPQSQPQTQAPVKKGLPLWKPPNSSPSSRSVSETPPSTSTTTPRSEILKDLAQSSKPRRSLAQSQFAWMLGDDTIDRNRGSFLTGGGGGGGGGGHSKSFSGSSSSGFNAGGSRKGSFADKDKRGDLFGSSGGGDDSGSGGGGLFGDS